MRDDVITPRFRAMLQKNKQMPAYELSAERSGVELESFLRVLSKLSDGTKQRVVDEIIGLTEDD